VVLAGGPALGKAELVRRLLALLGEGGRVSPVDVLALQNAILHRERLGSTGIGKGLAIPHLKHPTVARPLGALAACRPPVWFDAIDGEAADIVAMCLLPPDRPGQHLGEASPWSEGLFRRLADEAFRQRLRRADSADEVMESHAGGGRHDSP
jgi:mannitol/fructose-specific phosphotransferase system IIA component (Ntr-type)